MRSLKFSLVVAPLLALALGLVAARQNVSARTADAVTKQAVLDNIARTVLLAGYTDLAARARELATAADQLIAKADVPSLQKAQAAWKNVLLSWRRTQTFVHGPIADLDIYGRIQFWPSRRQSVDRVLRADRPIDDQYIQELGANAVGLSALEILLFDRRQDDAARAAAFSGPQGDRQRKYFRALAQELVKKTAAVEGAWQGPKGYAATFGAGGQDRLNLVVNDLLSAIEGGAQERLRLAIDGHVDRQSRAELIEGGLSGTSQSGLFALLTSANTMFSGGTGAGLDDYLKQLKLVTAKRVELQFKKTIDAVRAIDQPLEQAVDANAVLVKRAQDECRALEVMLKVEVASTMGVTLTFKSRDGD